jgi:hypothetical protein
MTAFETVSSNYKQFVFLYNQHGVSVAEKPVFIFYCFFVCIHCKIVSGKCTYHNQQTCFRQMKVGDQTIGNIELVRRMNKNVCPSFTAHCCGANRTNTMACFFCFIHDLASLFIDLVIFRIHLVFAEVFNFNWSERS